MILLRIPSVDLMNSQPPRKQPACGRWEHGFTLIELIMVIVLVGTVAVFAAPRLLDLSAWKLRAFAQTDHRHVFDDGCDLRVCGRHSTVNTQLSASRLHLHECRVSGHRHLQFRQCG